MNFFVVCLSFWGHFPPVPPITYLAASQDVVVLYCGTNNNGMVVGKDKCEYPHEHSLLNTAADFCQISTTAAMRVIDDVMYLKRYV